MTTNSKKNFHIYDGNTGKRLTVSNYRKYQAIMKAYGEDPKALHITDIMEIKDDMADRHIKNPADKALSHEVAKFEAILEELRTPCTCKRCHSQVYLSDMGGYDYYCAKCEESLNRSGVVEMEQAEAETIAAAAPPVTVFRRAAVMALAIW